MTDYLFMFPVSVLFAAVATMFGIGGSALFTPFLSIILGLPAQLAVGVGLFIEVFGFSSGLNGFARYKLINYGLGVRILCYSIPGVILGAMITKMIPDWIIMTLLSLLLIILGIYVLRPGEQVMVKDVVYHEEKVAPTQREIVPDPGSGLLSVAGGMLSGAVSVGLGEVNDYVFLKRFRLPGPVAAGTSVFVLAASVLIGAVAHGLAFFSMGIVDYSQVFGILIFAVPGVMVGAQLGVWLSQQLEDTRRERYIAMLFFAIAIVTIVSQF